MTPRQRQHLIVAAVVLALLVIASVGVGRHFDVGSQMRRCVGFFRDAGAWPFFAAMAVLPAVGFPVSAFNVVAGPVFGPTMGVAGVIACGSLAIAVNLAGCYWLAAGAMRPLMERLVKRLGYALPELPMGTAWEIILMVRIIPGPPLFLQNYLLGLARVPFGIYLLVSLLVQVAFLTATVTAGDALMRGDWRALAIAGALFVGVGLVMHRLRLRLAANRRVNAPVTVRVL
jgi:uncharacterized membrane protein YdjX (TVP38/TMEM64 family)